MGVTKPKGEVKVKAYALVGLGEISDPSGLGRITGSSHLLGRSKSKHVVTRKMVNYACVG